MSAPAGGRDLSADVREAGRPTQGCCLTFPSPLRLVKDVAHPVLGLIGLCGRSLGGWTVGGFCDDRLTASEMTSADPIMGAEGCLTRPGRHLACNGPDPILLLEVPVHAFRAVRFRAFHAVLRPRFALAECHNAFSFDLSTISRRRSGETFSHSCFRTEIRWL